MAKETKRTQNHATIRQWAEKRGGHPAVVKDTEDTGKGAGVLRIDFEGKGEKKEPSLQEISWDKFFQTFDKKDLTFLYQDKTADGGTSRFFKLVSSDDK